MLKKLLVGTTALFASAVSTDADAQTTDPYYYSPQDILIGANQLHSQGFTGSGINFAVIDTGVLQKWIGFSGPGYGGSLTPPGAGGSRIYNIPPSTCLNSTDCRNKNVALTDDNGHGTFVASEIIGSVAASSGYPNGLIFGVAPAGDVISVKVLDQRGSGSYTDVANGIAYAASHGAKVLNLSLGPFIQDSTFINAINTAASRGAVIVFAGGNSSATLNNGGNITGLTDQAI